MHALILAAGHGTRLRPYTLNRAKPSLPFLNVPLMGYSLYHLEQSGLSQLAVNAHHAPETIEKTVSLLCEGSNYKVHVVHEQPDILGSGGAVKNAQNVLSGGGDFIYANGDEVMLFNHNRAYRPLMASHKEKHPIATLMLCRHPDVGTVFNGVWIDKNKHLVRFGKEDLNDGTEAFHFTGVIVFSEKIFKYLPEGESNILHDGLIAALNDGEIVLGHIEEDLIWYETGNPANYLEAHWQCMKMLKENSPRASDIKNILKRFQCTSNIYELDGPSQLLFSQTDLKDPKVQLSGFISLGEGVRLGAGCSLKNCIVESYARVPENAQLSEQIILNADHR